ncbi:MAG: VCBS repeat-containing protein [Armatimonas sp.]
MKRLSWLLLLAFPLVWGCPKPTAVTGEKPADTTPTSFTEISDSAGVKFVHETGARGKKRMPETVGSGVAFFDYDNDGKLDILIINSCSWPDDPKPVRSSPKLYRNLGNGKFEDVTAKAGLERTFYGMGVSVGDYDNDGWEDIYLTAVGPNYLFHNNHGVFEDKTKEAGVIGVPLPGTKLENKWSSSSASARL